MPRKKKVQPPPVTVVTEQEETGIDELQVKQLTEQFLLDTVFKIPDPPVVVQEELPVALADIIEDICTTLKRGESVLVLGVDDREENQLYNDIWRRLLPAKSTIHRDHVWKRLGVGFGYLYVDSGRFWDVDLNGMMCWVHLPRFGVVPPTFHAHVFMTPAYSLARYGKVMPLVLKYHKV